MSSPRKNILLGTAGHVDHGKTALVKVLTGCDTDTLAEEKRRGLTIDLGFARCRMRDERIVGIVDMPGHVGFIRNMVAGAHGIDVVILVVAADDGVMPQTREHLDILTLLGVRHGLVALTKTDLVDAETRALAEREVRGFLGGTFLAAAPICPISNVTGEGFDGFFEALNAAVEACEPRPNRGTFRVWVERTFSVHGFGTVACGVPVSGAVRSGDRLHLSPGGRTCRVRRLQVYGEESDTALAGECVALNLADVEPRELQRGMVLHAAEALEPAAYLEAELRVLSGSATLKDYAEVHLHVGTAEGMAHVALLEGRPIEPGGEGLVQLRLLEPMPAAPGERFVVRAAPGGTLATVGGGRILGASDRRLRRNRPWTLQALRRRREALDRPAAWCEVLLAEAGQPLAVTELARRALLPTEQAEPLLAERVRSGTVLAVADGEFVHAEAVAAVEGRVLETLRVFHDADPRRLGMDRPALLEALRVTPALLDLALGRLLEAGVVSAEGERLSLPGRAPSAGPGDAALGERIEAALREARWATPAAAELAASLREPPERVEAAIEALIDRGRVVRLDGRVLFHRHAIDAAKEVALGLFRQASGFTTMAFRDALGVSRRYAVPLLDHLDTIRWTVRNASRRTPGVEARLALGRG